MTKGIKAKDIRDFEKYCGKLNEVMERIRVYEPEANGYLAMDSMCLMVGSSHDEECKERQDRIVTSIYMPDFVGGDW